jgi:hypothetical protein
LTYTSDSTNKKGSHMTCCNHDCDEGRGCPVRKVKPYPAVPDDMPIQYVPTWRDRLGDLARAMLLTTIVWIVSLTVVSWALS